VLSPVVANLEDASTRVVPRHREALRLLRAYLATLHDHADVTDPDLWRLVATHICDLVALAIGATRDGAEVARLRGVRAARLKAIKTDLNANPGLTLAAISVRQGVTPRYVQTLFEADGTTFTAYALNARLSRAYRMLTAARYAGWTISAIAYEAGFSDLSHFNRNFRRRYGASPSEVRTEAARAR
jgi:AraC-like DNA-binding protein